jgi:hypothetical protein
MCIAHAWRIKTQLPHENIAKATVAAIVTPTDRGFSPVTTNPRRTPVTAEYVCHNPLTMSVATGVELIHFHRFHRGPVIHPVARRRTCAVRSGVEARA